MHLNLRKALSFLLVLVLSFSVVIPSASAIYLPKDDPSSNNSSNILLVYTGYYNPANYDGEKIGDFTKEKFLPYVGYLDDNGAAKDYFFDTFLFLAIRTPYEGSLGRYYSWAADKNPGTIKDWQWTMDRMFVKDQQLDALNQAVDEVSSQLQDTNKKVNVYLTIPFPDPQSTDFGDFNGDGISESLESLDTRKEVTKWFIDEMTKRFNDQNYEHLKLAGFYWEQEDLDTYVPGEAESVQYASEYLNQQQMKLGWIPWSGAGEKANGNNFGFDFTLIQPNHYFVASSTIKRVEETADLAYKNGEGVEMEFDERALESPYYRQVMYNYLISGVTKQFMNDSILAYYQDVYGLYNFYYSHSPVGRQLYNDVYKFSKGTFEIPVGNFEGRVVDENGNPIAGATLKDEVGNISTTNASGEFQISGLFAIQHDYAVDASGFVSGKAKVDIAANETLYKDIVLITKANKKLIDSYSLTNFEGSMIYGCNNGDYVHRSMVTDPNYVYEGNQSLKVDYSALEDNWIRAYVDSDFPDFQDAEHYQAYTQKDWSQYDSVSMAVYNPTNTTQTFSLEILDQYNWGASYTKNFELAPQQWTIVEQSIPEMKDAGKNVQNMIRISLLRYNQSENLTLYFDDFKLNKYEQVQETKLDDFEGTMIYGTNNGDYVHRSMVTDPNYVYEGNQSLKIDYTALQDNWIRAYIDSDFPDFQDAEHYQDYTQKDWSGYDSVSMAVYNPTDKPQTISLEILDQYNWGAAYTKDFQLAPQQWTIVEQSIPEMKDEGKNVQNMIRISLLRYNQSENLTLYFDDLKLLKSENPKVAPNYLVILPSKVPTMDKGAVWSPYVINKAQNDELGNPVKVAATFTSSNPEVVEVQQDGTLKAISEGKALIRGYVGNIEALSTIVEVSPWDFNQFKGGKSVQTVGKSTNISVKSAFKNGYLIPADEATYTWEITGDSIVKTDNPNNGNNTITINPVKKGKSTVKVTMTYNGKTETFERCIRTKR